MPSLPLWSPPTKTIAIACDPDDRRLIEAARASQADVLVTGDQDLLTSGCVGQTEALTSWEFRESQERGARASAS